MSSPAGEVFMGHLYDEARKTGSIDNENEELVQPLSYSEIWREDELPETDKVNIVNIHGKVIGVLEYALEFGVESDGWGGRDVVVDEIKVKRL